MSKVLVVGANGQLGNELRLTRYSSLMYFSDLQKDDKTEYIDITDINAIRSFVKNNNIGVIVNCAAYTNVDKAEDDEKVADLINNKAVENLAIVVKEVNGFLVHVSTDYVFNGNNNVPYIETDKTYPTGVYGKTKLAGEDSIKRVMGENGNFVILRTAWLYSSFGKNFVKTMRKLTSEQETLKVVFDQVGTPTYAADLANIIIKILEQRKNGKDIKGIYHFSNEGVCSWYDFAKEIAFLFGNNKCTILPCHSNEFASKVKRPNYSVLDKSKIKSDLGIEIPYWIDSLNKCIKELIKG